MHKRALLGFLLGVVSTLALASTLFFPPANARDAADCEGVAAAGPAGDAPDPRCRDGIRGPGG